MGLFDWFKKKEKLQNSKSQSFESNGPIHKSKLDLSHPVIRAKVDWIKHPMEFGREPDAIRIVDERVLFWPSRKKEKCYLLEYKVDKDTFIGFGGPTNWSFFAIDYSKLNYEELYLRYTGWFIAFFTASAKEYDKSKEGSNREAVIKELNRLGVDEIKINQVVLLGNENYYDISASEGGQAIRVVGTQGAFDELDAKTILPFYKRIGEDWGPFNLS